MFPGKIRSSVIIKNIAVLLILLFPFVLYDALWACYATGCFDLRDRSEQSVLERARFLTKTGKYEMGEYAYRKILEKNPESFEALTQLASLLRHRGKYHESEELFLRAIAVHPKDDFTYVDLGKLYRNMKRYKEAEHMFDTANLMNPKRSETWSYGYAQLYSVEGKSREAEAAALKGVALSPNDQFAYMSLGDIYTASKKYDEAITAYKKAISLNPQSEAYKGLGWIALLQKDYTESEYWYKKYIEMIPSPRAEVYMGLGILERNKGDDFRALEYFKYAQWLDPTLNGQKEVTETKARLRSQFFLKTQDLGSKDSF